MKPIICITTGGADVSNYINAIEQCGGVPQVLSPYEEIREFDGLLLTGGGDIHPRYLNETDNSKLRLVDEERDKMELHLYKKVIKADKPVFGICRGIQVMNVAMGGNLYQDIPSEFPGKTLRHTKVNSETDSLHKVEIIKDSLLSLLTGEHISEVNSAHHQGVNSVADGFVVTARAEDGVIEAIENPSKRFVLGVQYHPERMLKARQLCAHALKLFEAFIHAVRDDKKRRSANGA